MKTALILAVASALLVSCSAKAETGEQMLIRASASFSDIPFDTQYSDVAHKLTKVDEPGCEKWEDCSYLDSNQVEHYFWFEEQELVLKMIDPKRFKNKPIPAMGIGNAIDKPVVLRNIQDFFHGQPFECVDGHGEYGSATVCTFSLGDGWTALFFDKKGHLVYIRLDAYQFT